MSDHQYSSGLHLSPAVISASAVLMTVRASLWWPALRTSSSLPSSPRRSLQVTHVPAPLDYCVDYQGSDYELLKAELQTPLTKGGTQNGKEKQIWKISY